jgi:hypothetical protein
VSERLPVIRTHDVAASQPVAITPHTGQRRRLGSGYVDPQRPNVAWVRFVCETPLRSALVTMAEEQNVSLSEIVRRACRAYITNQEA